MKYIIAMIRPEKLEAVKKELQKVEVNGLTVSSVSGYGAQRGHLEIERNKAKKYEANLLEKIKIEIAVNCTFRTLALLYHYAILKGHFVDIRLIKCPIVKYYCPILAGVRNVQLMMTF